jgi:cell division topological specificity factor
MRSKWGYSDTIALERLKLMVEAEPVECSPRVLEQMKKEISEIVNRYFELDTDAYEIKVVLKQNKKRA